MIGDSQWLGTGGEDGYYLEFNGFFEAHITAQPDLRPDDVPWK